MGESFGVYTIGIDGEVMRSISSANIACGFHAGDPWVMNRTVKLTKENGVGVRVQPGYPDLAGSGRRNINCTPTRCAIMSSNQIAARLLRPPPHEIRACETPLVPLRHVYWK